MADPIVVLTLEQLEETVTRAVRRALGEQQQSAATPRLLMTDEAAVWCSEHGRPVEEKTVREWCRSEVVAAEKRGGVWRISAEELERHLSGRRPVEPARAVLDRIG